MAPMVFLRTINVMSFRGEPIEEDLPKTVCFLLFFYLFSPFVLDIKHIHDAISQG